MPSKEFTVFQSVETWINNALQVALECQTAVVDLDIRVILEVILEVNRGRSLFLSPEEESKYGESEDSESTSPSQVLVSSQGS